MDLKAVNRFVSTLAGTFRSFYIYNQDNKAFDEILQNLTKRFQDTQNPLEPMEFAITNRALLFKGESAGLENISVPLASLMRNLGYKTLRFQAPIQSRHFFQFLHILTGKDSTESKNEKLMPLIADGEPKPISLVPLTVNSYLLHLSDETLRQKLAAIRIPHSQNGTGYIEKLSAATYMNTADFLMKAAQDTSIISSEPLKAFVEKFIEATREGYFPWDRFKNIFPCAAKISPEVEKNPISRWSLFMSEDIQSHTDLKLAGLGASASQDLDLAARLMSEAGSSNFTFGLSLLLRSMSENNPLGTQEKALKIATQVWTSFASAQESLPYLTLLSSLREKLASPTNLALKVFSIRNCTIEAPGFIETSRYFRSLGAPCLPALIKALNDEQDRSVRKKLCLLIGAIAREDGSEILIEALNGASTFLLRNLISVLGDIRANAAVRFISPHLTHAQLIVREEAVRTLTKIGTEEAKQALKRASL